LRFRALGGGLIPFGRGPGRLLDFGNKSTVEFANHRGQILNDSLPLGGVANRVLPVRDVLGRHWNCERSLKPVTLSMGEEPSTRPEPMRGIWNESRTDRYLISVSSRTLSVVFIHLFAAFGDNPLPFVRFFAT
jgi:hypothetical protein